VVLPLLYYYRYSYRNRFQVTNTLSSYRRKTLIL